MASFHKHLKKSPPKAPRRQEAENALVACYARQQTQLTQDFAIDKQLREEKKYAPKSPLKEKELPPETTPVKKQDGRASKRLAKTPQDPTEIKRPADKGRKDTPRKPQWLDRLDGAYPDSPPDSGMKHHCSIGHDECCSLDEIRREEEITDCLWEEALMQRKDADWLRECHEGEVRKEKQRKEENDQLEAASLLERHAAEDEEEHQKNCENDKLGDDASATEPDEIVEGMLAGEHSVRDIQGHHEHDRERDSIEEFAKVNLALIQFRREEASGADDPVMMNRSPESNVSEPGEIELQKGLERLEAVAETAAALIDTPPALNNKVEVVDLATDDDNDSEKNVEDKEEKPDPLMFWSGKGRKEASGETKTKMSVDGKAERAGVAEKPKGPSPTANVKPAPKKSWLPRSGLTPEEESKKNKKKEKKTVIKSEDLASQEKLIDSICTHLANQLKKKLKDALKERPEAVIVLLGEDKKAQREAVMDCLLTGLERKKKNDEAAARRAAKKAEKNSGKEGARASVVSVGNKENNGTVVN